MDTCCPLMQGEEKGSQATTIRPPSATGRGTWRQPRDNGMCVGVCGGGRVRSVVLLEDNCVLRYTYGSVSVVQAHAVDTSLHGRMVYTLHIQQSILAALRTPHTLTHTLVGSFPPFTAHSATMNTTKCASLLSTHTLPYVVLSTMCRTWRTCLLSPSDDPDVWRKQHVAKGQR